jgi:hypothetical protein
MGDIGASLCGTFDYVWERFTARLEGLDDAEYFWEPVRDCWSIHQGADGRWEIDGAGGNAETPVPPPITTIAWRIGHIAGMALGGFANRMFGDGTLTVDDLVFPPNAAEVPTFCDANYRAWRDGIATVDQSRWWAALGPKWGPYAESNTVDMALHVLDEIVHHAGEVGLLRDLYTRRDHLG